MTSTQQIADLSPRTKLRLSEVERLIRIHRLIVPVPSRRTLIGMCEDGTFETARPQLGKGKPQWLVFEDSFLRWVADSDAKPETITEQNVLERSLTKL